MSMNNHTGSAVEPPSFEDAKEFFERIIPVLRKKSVENGLRPESLRDNPGIHAIHHGLNACFYEYFGIPKSEPNRKDILVRTYKEMTEHGIIVKGKGLWYYLADEYAAFRGYTSSNCDVADALEEAGLTEADAA